MLSIPKIQKNVPLAPYTTYKIGGSADYFFVASDKDRLVSAINEARNERIPYFLLGTGANILVGDLGFRGLVIKNEAKGFKFNKEHLVVESGAIISDLITESTGRNLSGLEHFVGIPSSVGGALWQNLHFLAPDRKSTLFIGDIVESAEVLSPSGNLEKVNKDFFKFGYDYSILHTEPYIVTEVIFKLTPKNHDEINKQIEENMKWREEKQPQLREFPSCGSVFKKNEGVGAGRLIDQAGLKGCQIGGAKISEKHTNYFINTGSATAHDVLSLIKLAQEVVKEKTGYSLEPEVSFIGDFE
jgi:UDP-N-acetylmuramate dehydrogenase